MSEAPGSIQILVADIQSVAHLRAPGYLEALMSAGTVSADGQWLELEEAELVRLRAHYELPAAKAISTRWLPGDALAGLLQRCGIAAAVKRWNHYRRPGQGCGCGQRQATLNRWWLKLFG